MSRHSTALLLLVPATLLLLCTPLTGCSPEEEEVVEETPPRTDWPFTNALTLADQTLATPTSPLTIASLVADAPSLLAIHRDEQGFPGDILQVTPISKGSYTDLEVMLEAPVGHQERLHALLHVDSNANQLLDFQSSMGVLDPIALDAMALGVTATFTVSLENPPVAQASLEVADQAIAADVFITLVAIAAIEAPQAPVFVAIHASPDDLTQPLGFAAVNETSAAGVMVTLDTPVPHRTTLYAALHQDAGTPGEFEPDTSDTPVQGEDETALVVPFTVTLEPAPSAAFTRCALPEPTCDAPATSLPIDLAIEADHDGALLVSYEDDTAMTQRVIVPVSAGSSQVDLITLPEAACAGTFQIALLVDVMGLDPLTTSGPLPYATDAEGTPVTCELTRTEVMPPLGDAITALTIEPADTLTLTATLPLAAGAQAWLAVHATDTQGNPTEMLGNSALTASRTEGVTIALSRPVVSGETLTFRFYLDEGIMGTFEPEGVDPLVMDPADATSPWQAQLTASDVGVSEPFLLVADQVPEQPDAITLREAILMQPGFIVVFEDDGAGSPGAILGELGFEGVLTDAMVMLSRDLVVGETVHLALWVDDGNMMRDDATVDLPAERDGAPVTATITVLAP